jgi:hypothetical protein
MTQSSSATSFCLEDFLEYIESWPHDTIFKREWTRESLAAAISASIADGSFCYSERNGRIVGMCVGRLYDYGRYHIVAFQANDMSVIIEFIFTYMVRFAGKYPVLTATRRGKLFQLNPLRYLWVMANSTNKIRF